MTDASPPVAIPPLARQMVRALAQKGLTALATALTAYGVMEPKDNPAFLGFGLAAAAWFASFLWTIAQERFAHNRLMEALMADPPGEVK